MAIGMKLKLIPGSYGPRNFSLIGELEIYEENVALWHQLNGKTLLCLLQT